MTEQAKEPMMLCPFCGSDAVVDFPADSRGMMAATCGNCQAAGPEVEGSEDDAIEAFCNPKFYRQLRVSEICDRCRQAVTQKPHDAILHNLEEQR